LHFPHETILPNSHRSGQTFTFWSVIFVSNFFRVFLNGFEFSIKFSTVLIPTFKLWSQIHKKPLTILINAFYESGILTFYTYIPIDPFHFSKINIKRPATTCQRKWQKNGVCLPVYTLFKLWLNKSFDRLIMFSFFALECACLYIYVVYNSSRNTAQNELCKYLMHQWLFLYTGYKY
jgi:hypothetical protein